MGVGGKNGEWQILLVKKVIWLDSLGIIRKKKKREESTVEKWRKKPAKVKLGPQWGILLQLC